MYDKSKQYFSNISWVGGQKVPSPSLFGGEKRPRLSLSTPSGGWHMRTHNRYMPVLIMEKRILQMRLQIALSVSIVILVKYWISFNQFEKRKRNENKRLYVYLTAWHSFRGAGDQWWTRAPGNRLYGCHFQEVICKLKKEKICEMPSILRCS